MNLDNAQSLIEANPDFYFGLRAVVEDNYNVGDIISENSKSWHDLPTDGEIEAAGMTPEAFDEKYAGQIEGSCYWDEELDGVCASDVSDFSTIAAALEYNRKRYYGAVIYLLASKRAHSGEDEHEIIMTTPEVIAKFQEDEAADEDDD